MSQGSLFDVLTRFKSGLDMKIRVRFARDIARALRWLHSMKLIHRDIKSRNILLNEDLECKIIDFGTSRSLKSDKFMTKNVGSPAWIAPEVFLTDNYTEKADIYSFAIGNNQFLFVKRTMKLISFFSYFSYVGNFDR